MGSSFGIRKPGVLQESGQARVIQPSGALPVVVMSPLELEHMNSCLTLPSDLSSKVLAGQVQVQHSLQPGLER